MFYNRGVVSVKEDIKKMIDNINDIKLLTLIYAYVKNLIKASGK